MLKPRAVRPGARIAIVSPASVFAREDFDLGVQELRRLGYEPVWDQDVFATTGTYLSGSAELRAAAFARAWDDASVDALIAVRGGYGSVHLLPLLDPGMIRRTPKLFIGYSDHTSLLSWLTCQCGVTAVHGPMLEGRLAKGGGGYDEGSFTALLRGEANLAFSPEGLGVMRGGEATGPLFGGTIAQLTASLGTPYAFDPPGGCLLFLEDVNERPYRIDRMLTQLRLSGILARAAGVVFGDMRGCDEPGRQLGALDVIRTFMDEFTGPVITNFPSGHTAAPFWTLPLGVRVRMATSPRPSLIIEESPVE